MKKWTFALLLLLGTGTGCKADNERPIDISQLPQTAQTLISTHFKSQKVMLVVKETEGFSKGYDVIFENGDKIEFDRSGNWEEVDCNTAGVPTAILPAVVKQFVAAKHKDAKVMKISKDRNSTEVELSNGWELEFDKNGKLIDADRDMPGD